MSVTGGEVHARYNSTQTKATSLKTVTDLVSNKVNQVIDNYIVAPIVESVRRNRSVRGNRKEYEEYVLKLPYLYN